MTTQESLWLTACFSAIASFFALYFFLRGIIELITGKCKIAGVTFSGKKARIFSLFLIAQLPLALLLLTLLYDTLNLGGGSYYYSSMLQENIVTGTIWLAFSFGGLWLGKQYVKSTVSLTSKDKSSQEEMEQTDYTCELKDGRGEVDELEKANVIGRKNLSENCGAVYRVLSKSQRHINKSDKIHVIGTLTCSVCTKNFKVDFEVTFKGFLDYEGQHGTKCTHCGSSIQIIGESTEIENGKPKFWLIVLRRTVPVNANKGKFRLDLDSLLKIRRPASNSDDSPQRSSSENTPSTEAAVDDVSKGEAAQPNENEEALPSQKDPVPSSGNKCISSDLKECPHCYAGGILPMPGNICPNCKKAL